MKTDFKTLKELHEYYAVHNACGLKELATQPVYEITTPSSGILLIGEAPGRNEDLQGRPFVGSAGKFLDELLKSIGFSREEVYVSNVVKYRPPNNREPQEDEKDACRVWLNAELLFVKPRVIVTLGRHALGRFVPDAGITASHGQSFEHPTGIPVFAMYHPAAALYNPNLRDVLKKDFKQLKNFLDNRPKVSKAKQEEIDAILQL
ncbi:uracil-DNA glycosylase [Candidatus Dojkabacteria bacterium]|uniref:Type-4 uracil-DNA glycosylase n=1 Tax=Candidatus Dojkabacteria bacterium TaxID=2099670 RepID=A0A847D0P1_9BACT|nr:uracil-DNA glycosylase [Candidatus Dojkabacteria bacterium]